MKNDYRISGDSVFIMLNSPKYGDMETIISIEDFERADEFEGKWYANYDPTIKDFYVVGKLPIENRKRTSIKLHRWLKKVSDPKFQIDHINHNPLDNRRENLRVVTSKENNENLGMYANNTTGYKGVCWHKGENKWVAQIRHNKKHYHLGYFHDPYEAHLVYTAKKRELHACSTEYSLNGDVNKKRKGGMNDEKRYRRNRCKC